MKRKYELTVVFSPQLSSSELTKLNKSVGSLIEKAGGKVVKKEDWGTKKLSYAIAKQSEGVYRHFIVDMPSDGPAALDRELKLLQGILRHLLVIKEK
jgi:small subunit ribosomal protein S6